MTQTEQMNTHPSTPITPAAAPKRKSTAAEWVQAISLAVLALSAVILVADLLYLQYSLAQAADALGDALQGFGDQFSGGGAEEPGDTPCVPEPGNFDC